jgi:hypothetical protein
MKKKLAFILAWLLLAAPSLWAGHKRPSNEAGQTKKHSSKKASKGKKEKGSKKGNSGANLESQIKSNDVQFNSKSGSK